VTFYDVTGGSSTPLGTAPINSAGVAQLPTSFATPGPHSLTAVYAGDSIFNTSTGTLTETVSSTKTTGHVYVAASANPALAGQSITFSVSVYGTTSESTGVTGTVTLMDGTTPLGSNPVTNGRTTFTITSLSDGAHAITASYSGDSNFTAATSSVLSETVGPTGTISGKATLLNMQDTLNVNVQSRVDGGTPSYSGNLSFSDQAAGDTFNAVTITAVQIYPAETPAGGGATESYSYFRITGTATLNGGTSPEYSFVIAVYLPTAGTSNATGYLTITVTGPNGFKYSTQAKAFDPGSTIVITA
jgi:hypothetical protein